MVLKQSLSRFISIFEASMKHLMKVFSVISTIFLSHFLSFSTTITVLNTNDAGSGSLREAILISNDFDTIRFDQSMIVAGSDSIVLSSQISFSKSLTFKGLYNSTDTLYLSGGGTRIFRIQNTGNIYIDSMVFVNGDAFH